MGWNRGTTSMAVSQGDPRERLLDAKGAGDERARRSLGMTNKFKEPTHERTFVQFLKEFNE